MEKNSRKVIIDNREFIIKKIYQLYILQSFIILHFHIKYIFLIISICYDIDDYINYVRQDISAVLLTIDRCNYHPL